MAVKPEPVPDMLTILASYIKRYHEEKRGRA
jgi:hypothetical protein